MATTVSLSNEDLFPHDCRLNLLNVVKDIACGDLIPSAAMRVKANDKPEYFVLETTLHPTNSTVLINIKWSNQGVEVDDEVKEQFPTVTFTADPSFDLLLYSVSIRQFGTETYMGIRGRVMETYRNFTYWTGSVAVAAGGRVVVSKAPMSPDQWIFCVEYETPEHERKDVKLDDACKETFPGLNFVSRLEFAPVRDLVYCNTVFARSPNDPWDANVVPKWLPYSKEISLEIKAAVEKIQEIEDETYAHDIVLVGNDAEVGVILTYGTLLVGQIKIPTAPAAATPDEQSRFYKYNTEWRERPIGFSFECRSEPLSIPLQDHFKTRINRAGRVVIDNAKRART